MDPADLARNPYIAYNCIRVCRDVAVVANGTQADMILERIDDGQRPLDAIALSLVAYGYERDDLDTPRIAGAVQGDRAYLGIAKRDEFRAMQFNLDEDRALMVATYEKTGFEAIAFSGGSAGEIARHAYDLDLERPVCAAAAYGLPADKGSGYDLAVYNPM
jgi:IMP cyclohydrolase